MKRWQFWAGVAISLIFLYFALRGLNIGDVWQTLEGANYWWLIPGVLIYLVGVIARAWRWHYLLRPVKSIPTTTLFPITAIGYMGNNIYPARAGEVLRAIVLKKFEDVPISASLATIVVERVFDGVVMLGFVFLNLPELARLTTSSGFIGNIQNLALWGAGAFLGVLALFLLAGIYPERALWFVKWVSGYVIPARFREQVTGALEPCYEHSVLERVFREELGPLYEKNTTSQSFHPLGQDAFFGAADGEEPVASSQMNREQRLFYTEFMNEFFATVGMPEISPDFRTAADIQYQESRIELAEVSEGNFPVD